MNLNFSDLRVKMVLPLFLLMGLFLFSSSSVMAQNYKPLHEAAEIVKGELTEVMAEGAQAYNLEVTAPSETQLVARYEYFKYLLHALNAGDVEVAVTTTYAKMQEVHTTDPMKNAITIAHNRAVNLLGN